jgi:hypothetical protein
MRVLVTGATGKTGSRVVDRLHHRGVEVRAAGRGWKAAGGIRFDWEEPTTREDAFGSIDAAFLVTPAGSNDVPNAMQSGFKTALAAAVYHILQLAPLRDHPLVDSIALCQCPQATLAMLYRSTDCLCCGGALVQNLSHSASLPSKDNIAPSNSGIKHQLHGCAS